MKKILALTLIQVFVFQLFATDSFTQSQLKLRKDIELFLKEEGFMPEIDSDGDVKFKKEGKTYYVVINKKNESPMFLELIYPCNYSEKYPSDIVNMAATELNKYKGIKIRCYESIFYIKSDMFLVSAETFKYAFYSLMTNIGYVIDDFHEECENAINNISNGQLSSTISNKIPFLITSMEIADVDYEGKIIQDYGSKIYSYKTNYLQPKIHITSSATPGSYEVYVKLYKDGALHTSNSSPEGYTYSDTINISENTGSKSYTLSGWGSKTKGIWSAGEYRFEVWYGNYCLGSKSFKIL